MRWVFEIFCHFSISLYFFKTSFSNLIFKLSFFRPDADISGLNLTPSEKIYFRYFGSPGSSDTHAGESGSSTPLPNGVNDASQQQGAEQNGVSLFGKGCVRYFVRKLTHF